MDKIIDKLNLNDLTEEQQQLAELIGNENYYKLIKTFGGLTIYIPKIESIERSIRNDCVRKDYNGYNTRELARKYGLTENSVRIIVSEISKEMKRKPIEGQESFF